jgi:hypothetical protein
MFLKMRAPSRFHAMALEMFEIEIAGLALGLARDLRRLGEREG